MTTIEAASMSLSSRYYLMPWFVSCGITGPSASDKIIFMVTNGCPANIRNMVHHDGFKVEVKVTGRAIAAPAR